MLAATLAANRRATALRHRLHAGRARTDTRDWQVERRERTRQMIELGGLVAKAGLGELTGDDRAVILGITVEAAARLRSEDREAALLLWRRRCCSGGGAGNGRSRMIATVGQPRRTSV